jgi:hypothetical protein
MTKKKTNPIEQHKNKDLKLCREKLLEIIQGDNDNATALKAKVDAIKTLGRFHHALQPDKVQAKAVAQQIQAQKVEKLTAEEEAHIDSILSSIPAKALRQ